MAAASNPDEKSSSAVALGVEIGIYTNTALAEIEATSLTDAVLSTNVSSSVSYPILTDPLAVLENDISPNNFLSAGAGQLGTLLDGTLGFGSSMLNTWVMSQANSGSGDNTSVSGSIAVNVFENSSQALIAGGARVNQILAGAKRQSVTVSGTRR